MGEPCKHGHIDGVMHKPCPECTSEMRFENEIVLCKQIDKLNARNEELKAHIAEFERQSRERCRHDANRIKELQAQLALKNHPVLLWQENKKLQSQVDAVQNAEDGYICDTCGRLDYLCGKAHGLCRTEQKP